MEKHKFRISIRGRILPYFIFWIGSFYILLNFFSSGDQWQRIDFIYTTIFLFTLIVAVVINFWFIMPRYLNTKRYTSFFLFSAFNILLCAYFNHFLFAKLIDYVLPGYYFISYYGYQDLLKFFFVFVGLTTLLHLSWQWFLLQETQHRMVVLEKEKINAEFKALMNQVNPHFLFNSLTVLYALALDNSKETPGVIIKLSDILRYVIYDAATGPVPLKSEILMIRNFIDLQRYRVDPTTRINFTMEIENENLYIAPMLFLPLVENSFKHGVKGEIRNAFIDILLKEKEGLVSFIISNNKSDSPFNEKSQGGIGIKNIEARLILAYPDRYSFSIEETEKLFTVHLKLKAVE